MPLAALRLGPADDLPAVVDVARGKNELFRGLAKTLTDDRILLVISEASNPNTPDRRRYAISLGVYDEDHEGTRKPGEARAVVPPSR